jgi:hypothetical protein
VSLVRTAEFRLISGEEAVEEYRTSEGFRCFCRRCGGRLFNRPLSTGKFLSLVIATLDDEPEQRPVMHINVESKARWYDILDDLPQHDVLPPSARSMIAQ